MNPKVATPSIEATKFRRFPTKAIPLGPIKTAITFEETKPIIIFKITLTLFNEVILNNSF